MRPDKTLAAKAARAVPARQPAGPREPSPAARPRRRPAPAASGPKDRLRVVWLGRRRIPGVDAGTELRLQGMVTVRDGLPTMFNPRYEILSRQEDQ